MDKNNIPYSDSEVSGVFLLGMLESFSNTHILAPELIPFSIESIKPDGWYPSDYLVKLNILIEEKIHDSDSILFWAGVKFMHLWYWHGLGKDTISSELLSNVVYGGSCSSLLMSLHFFHPIDEANIFHYICEEFKTS